MAGSRPPARDRWGRAPGLAAVPLAAMLVLPTSTQTVICSPDSRSGHGTSLPIVATSCGPCRGSFSTGPPSERGRCSSSPRQEPIIDYLPAVEPRRPRSGDRATRRHIATCRGGSTSHGRLRMMRPRSSQGPVRDTCSVRGPGPAETVRRTAARPRKASTQVVTPPVHAHHGLTPTAEYSPSAGRSSDRLPGNEAACGGSASPIRLAEELAGVTLGIRDCANRSHRQPVGSCAASTRRRAVVSSKTPTQEQGVQPCRGTLSGITDPGRVTPGRECTSNRGSLLLGVRATWRLRVRASRLAARN